ncbi:hypothetical protein SEUBUCD650_0E02050 [Saccharomyces eubayanus]|uniref:BOI1-like protein n=1 Tax=Saccharomyces eubayanus TaxID=1080349 RepID=A0ABN8VPA5_SACEU|nr:hypothetical protein SEUBUCD650_0E02050 [Saccharomyces eubayanus]
MSSERETPALSQLNTSVGENKDASQTLLPEYDNKGSISGREGGNFPTYIAINEYYKRMEDELDMKPGDKIKVITDDEIYKDGWYFGRNLRTNEEGLYPVVFTQKITVDRTPTLMRAKSTKRVYSPLAHEDPLLSSTFINENDSTSELPTPQPIETAASISRNTNGKLDRNLSLKNTMSDIDNALREFNEGSEGAPDRSIASSRDEAHSITHETILSTTDGLDVIEANNKPTTSGSTKPLSNSMGTQATFINGIDTTKLNPVEAEMWTPEEITAYFIMEGYDVQSASRFQKHKISGRILLELELVHLKELDINSFGTRFEIFKEIEKIKEAIRTNGHSFNRVSKANNNTNSYNQLMPPANVDQRVSYRGHVRKTSQSLDDLPSQQNFTATPQGNRNSSTGKHRPKSLTLDTQEGDSSATPKIQIPQVVEEIASNEYLFVSPRRAPKPPSYPSPAQPPKSPLLSNRKASPSPTQLHSWQSPSSSYSDSKKNLYTDQSSSNSNSNSRFALSKNNQGNGRPLSPIPPPTLKAISNSADKTKDTNTVSANRNSVLYSGYAVDSFNRKSSYSSGEEEHFQETLDTLERPTSSIYADGSTIASMSNARPIQDNEKKKKPTRHSSLLSSKSKGDPKRNSSLKRSSSASRTSSFRKSTFMLSPFRQQFTENAARSSPSPEKNSMASTPLSPTDNKSSKDKSKARSVSAKDAIHEDFTEVVKDDKNKRSVSEAVKGETLKGKSLRQMTTRPLAKKKQTSAFVEGLRNIGVKEAMKNADFSGWMSKKGSGAMSTWKTRFFTLHGTRLSYFSSTTDTRERGLIDVTAHRVIPAKEDDKLVSLYAASTGKGRYCFKLLPPQPGSKKGLTFTQPRTHYFAVESKEEMRGWMAALIKTTIDIDTSVPVISSYTTPTVSLSKAQEMLAEAREETKIREQQILENEEDEDQLLWDQQQQQQHHQDGNQSQADRTICASTQRTSDEDNTISTPNLSSATNTTVGSNGFSSPFLLASGMLSPGLARNNSMRGPDKKNKLVTEEDYFGQNFEHKGGKI